jgi:hypothetical protein
VALTLIYQMFAKLLGWMGYTTSHREPHLGLPPGTVDASLHTFPDQQSGRHRRVGRGREPPARQVKTAKHEGLDSSRRLPLAAGRRCFQAHLAEFQAHLAEVYGAGVGVVARVKPRVLANEAVGGPCFWRDVARRQVTRAGNGIVTERVREEGGRVRPGWRCGVVGG